MSVTDLNALMALDPRFEGYQGFHVNKDGSLLLVHRHGGAYHTSVEAYQASLAKHLEQVSRSQPQPQPAANAS